MGNLTNHSAFAGLFIIFALLYASACGDDQTCVDALVPDCSPLYEPTFEQVFNRTLKPGCAVEGSSCHSGTTAKGGLRLDEIEMSYQLLVPDGRVVPGDPSCSLVTTRLAGANGGVMPPGSPLSEAERCSIEMWIANGAQR